MADITMSIVAGKDLAARFAGAAGGAHTVIRRELGSAMLRLQSTMGRNVARQFHRHTGQLENIVIEPIVESGEAISGRVGPSAEYGEIQERGGTITAKNVRNLTIPLSPFMTGRGWRVGRRGT